MVHRLRKKRILDLPLQGTMILRVLVQWAILLACAAGTSVVLQFILDPLQDSATRVTNLEITALSFGIVTLFLMPVFVWDLIKFSHQFVGPIVRLRSFLNSTSLRKGECELSFRQGDYWQDLASEFNEMLARIRDEHQRELEQLRSSATADDNETTNTLVYASGEVLR